MKIYYEIWLLSSRFEPTTSKVQLRAVAASASEKTQDLLGEDSKL
jgi:hypothetical protein